MECSPEEVEDMMNIDDPKASEVFEDTFPDIDPPLEWKMCTTCRVKGDIDSMLWCHICGIIIYLK